MASVSKPSCNDQGWRPSNGLTAPRCSIWSTSFGRLLNHIAITVGEIVLRQKQKCEQTAIELARDISQTYGAAYATAKSAKRAALQELGWADDGQSVSKLAVALTQTKIEPLLGHRFQRSTIYRYIRVASQLSAPVQSLARVHRFSLRVLVRLSRLTPDQQHDLALSLANKPTKAKQPCLILLEQIFKQSNDLCKLLEKGVAPNAMARQWEFRELRCVVATAGDVRAYLDGYHRCALLLLREKYFDDDEMTVDCEKSLAINVQNPAKKVAQ